MNPILASGLIGVGEKIVTNLINTVTSPSAQANPNAPSFDALMQGKQVGASGDLGTFLAQNGVNDWDSLAQLQQHLTMAIQNQPELAQKLAGLNPGTPLSLKVTEGNLLTIESPEGTVATLDRDSEAGQIAMRLHGIKSMQMMHEQLPGATLSQTAKNVHEQPILNVSWSLREGL